MADIFLSYATEDRETAGSVARLLEAAGWSVWWDRRIAAGETWRSMIERALGDMRCMVVLWSSHSVTSEWVAEEAEEAKARAKPVVPALIEAVKPPLGWRQVQAIDLSQWNEADDDPIARQFVADVAQALGARNPRATDNRFEQPKWRLAPKRTLQRVAMVLAGVGVAAGIGVYVANTRPPEIAVGAPAKSSAPTVRATETPERDVPMPTPTVTYVPIEPRAISPAIAATLKKNPPAAGAGAKSVRCTRIMESAQLGELSPEDRAFFRKECKS